MLSASVLCMAIVIYHEARGEPLEGRRAVADVVLNRVSDSRWPDSVCGVVFDAHQFTDIEHVIIKDKYSFEKAKGLALHTLSPKYKIKYDADHYHALSTNPYWNKDMLKIGVINNHVFYRSR